MSLREDTRDALDKLAVQNDRTGTRLDGLEEQVTRIDGLVVHVWQQVDVVHDKTRQVQLDALKQRAKLVKHRADIGGLHDRLDTQGTQLQTLMDEVCELRQQVRVRAIVLL